MDIAEGYASTIEPSRTKQDSALSNRALGVGMYWLGVLTLPALVAIGFTVDELWERWKKRKKQKRVSKLEKLNGSLFVMTVGPEPCKVEIDVNYGRVYVEVPEHQQVEIATSNQLNGWKQSLDSRSFFVDLEQVG